MILADIESKYALCFTVSYALRFSCYCRLLRTEGTDTVLSIKLIKNVGKMRQITRQNSKSKLINVLLIMAICVIMGISSPLLITAAMSRRHRPICITSLNTMNSQ